jgi:hypothetical protein
LPHIAPGTVWPLRPEGRRATEVSAITNLPTATAMSYNVISVV